MTVHVVTGAAGFIGSHVVDALLASGARVTGVDNYSDNYPRRSKERNLEQARMNPRFTFHEVDLSRDDLDSVLEDAAYVYHLAARPGVATSWRDNFDDFVSSNVSGTHRLLEACRDRSLQKFVLGSSGSVYGSAAGPILGEDVLPRPHSPYAVTKLAAEGLALAYAANFGLPVVALRYFYVYGPRQRPDVAVHKMIEAALQGGVFQLFGSDNTVRDFVYVDDIVAATLLAATAATSGTYNVCSGRAVPLHDVAQLVDNLSSGSLATNVVEARAGYTGGAAGDPARFREATGWRDAVPLEEGVRRQYSWHKETLTQRRSLGSESDRRPGK